MWRIWGISHLQVNILVRKILKMKVKTTKTEKVEMLILQQEGLNLHSAEPQHIPEESRVTMGD